MNTENAKQQWLLVKFSDNWADEIDLEGFRVVTREAYDAYVTKRLKQYPNGFCRYFGTNEENEYASFQDYLDQTVTCEEITEEEAKVLEKFFPDGSGFKPLY